VATLLRSKSQATGSLGQMKIQGLLSHLDGVKETGNGKYLARCPAHDDRSPSLSITECDGGRILINCFAGCPAIEIVEAVGLRLSDLCGDNRIAPRIKSDPERAMRLWNLAVPTISHPYLSAKKIKSYGLRGYKESLVVPVTLDKKIRSLQFIQPTGEKRLLKGRSTSERYIDIGKPTDHVWLVEGYATGASVYMATGKAVVVAFSARNLPVVTKHLVGNGMRVFVAADNDKAGQIASDGALAAGAKYSCWPDDVNDWNDYATNHDAESMSEVMYGA